MLKEIIKREKIVDYLLGDLSEAETERLDQLSVADDDFADTLMVAEDELVDAFVAGKLDEKDTERFNSHYLATPLRRRKVEFAQALVGFGDRITVSAPTKTASSVLSKSTSTSPIVWIRNWLKSLISPHARFQWAGAAILLILLAAGVVLLVDNFR